MAETAAQKRAKLAAELKRLEAEGSDEAGKLRDSLDKLDARTEAMKGHVRNGIEERARRMPPPLIDEPASVDHARDHLDYAWPKRPGRES